MARWPLATVFIVFTSMAFLPAVSGQGLDLASGELYGLRVEAEYKLGPKDTEGHQAGAWGAAAPAPYANSGREWVFGALGPLSAPIELDADGVVTVSAWMGGGDTELGQHDVAWELKAGETVIATGEAKEFTFVREIVELTWEVAPAVTAIDPSMGDLAFRIYTTGIGHGLRINLGETPGWTRLMLPVVASGGGGGGESSSTSTSTSDTGTSTTASSSSTAASSSSSTTFRDEETTSSSSSSATGNATDNESKDSPAPPLAFAGLAVLAAAFAMRRRLH